MSVWRELHKHSLGEPRKEDHDTYADMFIHILKLDKNQIPNLFSGVDINKVIKL